jgi:hypothetical protein
MGRKYMVISFLMLLAVTACQEIYTPQVTAGREMPVVEGLLTDQPGSCRVRIFYAVPFDDPDTYPTPVTGASVSIREDDSTEYLLHENTGMPGEYISPSLSGEAGHQYTLIIRMEGEEYHSTPQLMMPAHPLDTIFGEMMTKDLAYKNSDGDIYYRDYTGANIHVGFRDLTDESKGFRLVYDHYLQYVASELDQLLPPTYYIWHKEKYPYELNVTGSDFPLATDHVFHELCFFPFDKNFYSFVQNWPDTIYSGGMNAYVVMIDAYHLNEDAWEYYKALKKQLEAEGKMFDPIAAQLPGNMFCPGDLQRKVPGFFEVSSWSSCSCKVINPGGGQSLEFRETHSLKGVPNDGYRVNMQPPFWVY